MIERAGRTSEAAEHQVQPNPVGRIQPASAQPVRGPLLTPQTVVGLQRAAGNASVTSLLRARRAKPAEPRHGPASPAQSAPSTAHGRRVPLQRSVGFEFETSWLVEKADGTPFEKYDPIYTGVGWTMEADTPSGGRSDVEFVVKPPFEESAGGLVTLGAVMPAIQNHFGNMIAAAGGARHTLRGGPANAFVDPGLQNDVVFTAGDGSATPQTTVGVRLERLVALLQELSRPNSDAKSELLNLADRGTPNAQMIGKVVDVIQGTPSTLSLRDHNRGFAYAPSAAMRGFMAMLLLYLRRGAVVPGVGPYAQAFKYAKIVAIIMARTDFAGMFRQLPPPEKDHYTKRPEDWVKFVLDAASDTYHGADFRSDGNVIARGMKGDPPKFKKNGSISKAGKVTPIPISRKDWLMAMLLGHDLLNAETFARYKPKEKVQFSGAFGALGTKTDDVGALQAHKGVILELREVRHDRDYRDWMQFAEDVFDYIMQLNAYDPAGAGAAPHYTKTATPGRGVRA